MRTRRGDWVRLADISPALRQALGIVRRGQALRTLRRRLARREQRRLGQLQWHTRTRGASTLTMQLAGLLDDDLALGAGGRARCVRRSAKT